MVLNRLQSVLILAECAKGSLTGGNPMKNKFITLAVCVLIVGAVVNASAQTALTSDIIPTANGDVKITFIGHGSLMFTYQKKVIHVDPFGRLTDYTKLPKADLILITHDHMDHLDSAAIALLKKEGTAVIAAPICEGKIRGAVILRNGESKSVYDINVLAVPAYNIKHKQPSGEPFHVKGEGNGYVLAFGNKRIYIGGDTENIPEMAQLKNIDVAFLPMNLPYTMTPEMAADAARSFLPKIFYPYHFGESDTSRIRELLKNAPSIDVRIREMK
jgi:L-ascorbate metabolism protein UlaG (beta-lactamase superfamily)